MRMILCLALGVIFGCSMREAFARDVGQWEMIQQSGIGIEG